MMEILPYVDVIFGSASEARAVGSAHKLEGQGIEDVSLFLSGVPKKNGKTGRLVVITQGPQPAVMAKDGQVRLFPVLPIDRSEIRDTNGAGDAFAGGFLAGLVTSLPLDECVHTGFEAADYVIKQRGFGIGETTGTD